ncbi:MAG: hypothetical protein U0228_14940 [Myxococcaceae bacterium]
MVTSVVVLLALAASDPCSFECSDWKPSGLECACRLNLVAPAGRVAGAMRAWKTGEAEATCGLSAAAAKWPDSKAAWRACVQQFPGVAALWVGLAVCDSDAPPIELLATVRDPREIFDRVLPLEKDSVRAVAREATRRDPGRWAAVLASMNEKQAFEVAWVELTTPSVKDRKRPDAEWEALARAVFRRGLMEGWLEAVADTWKQLPASVKARFAKQPLPEPTHHLRRESDPFNEIDLRPHLALALLSAGLTADARSIARPAHAVTGQRGRGPFDDRPEVRNADAVDRLLALALATTAPSEADQWELVVDLSVSRLPLEALVVALPWMSAQPELFTRVVEHTLADDGLGRTPDEGREAMSAADARAMARLREAWAKSARPSTDAGVVATVGVLPPPAVKPVPWPWKERASAWTGAAGHAVSAVEREGFKIVRQEQVGDRYVGLALSQRVDPTGEVTGGGYWLSLTQNDGTHREVYLGFSMNRPWRAADKSAVPLLAKDGVVRVEAAQAPLDEGTITFPPVSTKVKVLREHVVLEAKLADLERDTDGDGLTDLLEMRLLLDPANADTDGDGMRDGVDTAPRLDDRLPPSPLANMISEYLGTDRPRGLRALAIDPQIQKSALELQPIDLDRLEFVLAEPGELVGLRPRNVKITLSRAELEEAKKVFGAFYPRSMRIFGSRDGKHAVIVGSEGWAGDTVRLDEQEDGTWKSQVIAMWMS